MVRKDAAIPTYVQQKLNLYGELKPDMRFYDGARDVRIVFDNSQGNVAAYLQYGGRGRVRRFGGEDKAEVVTAVLGAVFRGRRSR